MDMGDKRQDLDTFLHDMQNWESFVKGKKETPGSDASSTSQKGMAVPESSLRPREGDLRNSESSRLSGGLSGGISGGFSGRPQRAPLGGPAGVVHRLAEALDVDEEGPPDAASEKDRGNALFKAGRWREAAECYARSVALQPTAVAHANWAMALVKLKKFEEAEEECSAALALDDHYVKAYSRRATCRHQTGRYQEALEDLDFALGVEPENKELQKQRMALLPLLARQEIRSSKTPEVDPEALVVPRESRRFSSSTERTQKSVVTEEGTGKPAPPAWRVEPESQKPRKSPPHEWEWGGERARESGRGKTIPEPTGSGRERERERESGRGKTMPEPTHIGRANDNGSGRGSARDSGRESERVSQRESLSGRGMGSGRDSGRESGRDSGRESGRGGGGAVRGVTEAAASAAIRRAAEAAREAIRRSPKAPKSAFEFEALWKMAEGERESQALMLERIEPATLPSLFKDALNVSLLLDILLALNSNFFPEKAEKAAAILENLTKVPRFNMTTMFLTPKDRAAIQPLWETAASTCSPEIQERIAKLRKAYRAEREG